MAKQRERGFDALLNLAKVFVEKNRGAWDHTAWMEFLSEVQAKGYDVSETMRDYLGLILESMKRVYNAMAGTQGVEKVMSETYDLTVKFIQRTRGVWDQSGWETYLKDFQKKGFDLTDETSSYLVGVLDAARELYTVLPPSETKKEKKSSH